MPGMLARTKAYATAEPNLLSRVFARFPDQCA